MKRGAKRVLALLIAATCVALAVTSLRASLPLKPMFRMDGRLYAEQGAIEHEIDLLALQPSMLIGAETTGYPQTDGQAHGIRTGTQIYAVRSDRPLYKEASAPEDTASIAVYRSGNTWYLCAMSR